MESMRYSGIDVDKAGLHVALRKPSGKEAEATFSNDEAGIASLLAWYEAAGVALPLLRVTLEATSTYHRQVAQSLARAGARVDVMNPQRVRSLAIGLEILDKDDRLDAKVLATASELVARKQIELRNPLHEELRDLSRLIDSLKSDNARNKKRLASLPKGGSAHTRLKAAIQALALEIRTAIREWDRLSKEETEIRRRYDLARSVKDVGTETARVVACELPADLDAFRTDQLCAYAGVVPRRRRSGNQALPDSIGEGGNAHLRTGLFMASGRTVFLTHWNKDLYDRLRAKGKTHLQAMIAVIHRMLRNIVAALKRNQPWNETPPQKKKAAISGAAP